jgi:hypothetical protein
VSGQSRGHVPAYVSKILDLLEASSPFSPGAAVMVTVAHDPRCPMATDPSGRSPIVTETAWTVTVAHEATCPMRTDARAECGCDPAVKFAERRAVWHPWN